MAEKKPKPPKRIEQFDAAGKFHGDRMVTIDRETQEPMVWEPKRHLWLRGEKRLRAQVAHWIDRDLLIERNPDTGGEVKVFGYTRSYVSDVAALIEMEAMNGCSSTRGLPFDDKTKVLGLPDGQVADLRTGEVRRGNHEDRVTMRAEKYPAKTPTPAWDQFLDEATCGREDMKRYLLRLAGYTLTGDPREEIVVLLKGTGLNGKGTFLRVLREVMGEYSVEVAPDFFKPSAQSRHTTELADLHRRRLIVQAEAAEGQWLVQRIKMLAGGDGKLRARRMRQDQSDVVLMGVPWFGVNNTPTLQGGLAMERRLRVVPFDFKAEKDNTLKTRLAREYTGILHQFIQEAAAYLAEGLIETPESVRAESKAFMVDTASPLDTWLGENTEKDPDAVEPFNDLLVDMRKWFEDGGYKTTPSAKRLAMFLRDRDFQPAKRGRGERVRLGIRLTSEPEF